MIEKIDNDLLLLISTITEKTINNLHFINQDKVLNIYLFKIFSNEAILKKDNLDWSQFKQIMEQNMLQNGYKINFEFDLEQIENGSKDFIIAAIFQMLSVYKIFNEFQFEQKVNLLDYQSKNCIEEILKEMIQEIVNNKIESKKQKNEMIENLYRKIQEQEQKILKFENLNFQAQNKIQKLKNSLQNQSSTNSKLQQDIKRLSVLHSDSIRSYQNYSIKSIDSLDELKELKKENEELKQSLKKQNYIEEQSNSLKAKFEKIKKDFDDIIEQNNFYKTQQNEYEKIFSENQINKKLIEKYQNDINQKSQKYLKVKDKIQDLKLKIQKLEMNLKLKDQQILAHIDQESILKEFSLTRINSIDDEVFVNELQEENIYLRNKLNQSKTDKQLDFENIPLSNKKINQKQKLDTSIEKVISYKKDPFKKNSLQIFMEENNCVFQSRKSTKIQNKKKKVSSCDCYENIQIMYEICAEFLSSDMMKKQKLLPTRKDRNRNIIRKFCFQNLLNKERLRQLNQQLSSLKFLFYIQGLTSSKQLSIFLQPFNFVWNLYLQF